MKPLGTALRGLRLKMQLNIFITSMLVAVSTGLFILGWLFIASKLIYIYNLTGKALVISVVYPIVGMITGLAIRPSMKRVAMTADRLGYKERFITAYEASLRKNKSPMEEMVISDALACTQEEDFAKGYSVKPGRVMLYILAASIVFALGCYFVPIPPSEEMQQQQELHERLDKAVEQMKEGVQASALTEAEQREVLKQLNDLKKELSTTKSNTEAVSKLMNTQTELKKLANDRENEQLKALGERLMENKATQEIGEMLKNGNISQVIESLEAINENLGNMSQEELSALGKALSEAADSTQLDSETSQLLNDLGETLQQELTSEQLAQVSQNLSELTDKINELAKENQELREAVNKLNKKMASTGEQLGGKPGEMGQTPGEGNGQPMPREGQGGNTQQPGGEGAGTGSIDNANIYTSKAQDYGDYEAQLDENGNPTGEIVRTQGDGDTGEMVPYTRVFAEYRDEALNNIENEDIPYGVKDIVRDYFTALE